MAPAEAVTKQGCLVHKRDGPSHGFGLLWDRDSNRADDKITFDGGNELSLWALVPEGTVRGRVCRGPAEDPLPVFRVQIDGDKVLVGPRVT